jgi:hypothetical protein
LGLPFAYDGSVPARTVKGEQRAKIIAPTKIGIGVLIFGLLS